MSQVDDLMQTPLGSPEQPTHLRVVALRSAADDLTPADVAESLGLPVDEVVAVWDVPPPEPEEE